MSYIWVKFLSFVILYIRIMSYVNKFGYYDSENNFQEFTLPASVVQNLSGGTSNRIARFDSSGTRIKNSAITISDTGDLTGVGNISATSLTTATGNLNITSATQDIDFKQSALLNCDFVYLTRLNSVAGTPLEYNAATGQHNFFNQSLSNVASISASSNLSLNPSGSIECNNKDVNGVRNLYTSENLGCIDLFARKISNPVSNLVLDSFGTSIEFSNKTLTNINNISSTSITTNTIQSSNNTMSINPLISCNFNNKDVTNIGKLSIASTGNNLGVVLNLGQTNSTADSNSTPICIDLGSSVSSGAGHSISDQKIRIYTRTGTADFMGISANNSGGLINSFGGVNSGNFYFRWVATNSERMRLTAGGSLLVSASISTPVIEGTTRVQTPSIITTTGDLSINPNGSNINFNNKNLINVANIPVVSTSAEMTFTATNWTGDIRAIAYKVGRQVTLRLYNGAIPNTTSQNTFGPTQTILTGFRPMATMCIRTVDDAGLQSWVSITATGTIAFQSVGSNYTTANGLNYNSYNSYITFLTP